MGRTLSILLVLVGLTVVAPPAHGAVSVTISASRTTLPEGESVVFSGKAVGAKPGSVVELQRKLETGWETVKSKAVSSIRAYRFRTTPPRGYQKYRVFKPRQLGQASAVSGRVQLTVQWTPALSVQATLTEHYTVHVDGVASQLPAWSTVRREVFEGGAWTTAGYPTQVRPDGTFLDSFSVTMNQTYRYTVAGEGPRLQVASNEFEFTELPDIAVPLNTTTLVSLPPGATERILRVHLDQGQSFTFFGPDLGEVSLVEPSGQPVPGFQPMSNVPFTMDSPMTGEYAMKISRLDAREWSGGSFTLSTPLVIPTSLDAPDQDIITNLPGRFVELVFAAEGGSLVSESAANYDPYTQKDPWGEAVLLDPEGEVVAPWRGTYENGRAWRLPEKTGTYTVRITPQSLGGPLIDRRSQSVLAGREVSMTVDGAPAHMSLDRPGRIGEVTVTVPAGLDMLISNNGPDHLYERLFDPEDQEIDRNTRNISETKAGTYTAYVSYRWGTAEFDYYASTPVTYDVAMGAPAEFDLGPAPGRNAIIRIPVTAATMFSFEVVEDIQGYCRQPSVWVVSGRELLTWQTSALYNAHPSVFKVAESGELVLRTTSCTGTGTFRLVPAAVVQSVDTGTTTDQSGNPVTTSVATLEASAPGQVMILEYNGGTDSNNVVDFRATGSTFPSEARFTFSVCGCVPGHNYSQEYGANGGAGDTLASRLYHVYGPEFLFFWAGPSFTGTLDLELTRVNDYY